MNSVPGTWYNELYRIFDDHLLSVAQTIMLGQCLKAIQVGQNAEYHLNELYYSLGATERDCKIKEALDEYIHAYIKHYKEDINNGETEHEPTGSYERVDTTEDDQWQRYFA